MSITSHQSVQTFRSGNHLASWLNSHANYMVVAITGPNGQLVVVLEPLKER
jgi:hypothetical protein